jgi:hypothetical protein
MMRWTVDAQVGTSRVLAGLVAVVVAAFGIYFMLATTSPVVMSDGWYFVDAWLIPWQDGSFTVADLWAKRHGNHAQPIAALIFLANAAWFGLDMSYETMAAIVIASGFAALLYALARREAPQLSPHARAWLLAAIVCIVFSINAKDKIAWSIVGLFYIGHCLGLLFLCHVARQRDALRPFLLFVLATGLCVLVDTTGLLWCVAAMGCLLLGLPHADKRERLRIGGAILLLAISIGVYLVGYRWLAPPPDGPPQASLGTALAFILSQLENVVTLLWAFGTAYARQDRLAPLMGPAAAYAVSVLLTLACLVSHAWMWWTLLRMRMSAGRFVAGGLALFAYGTLAGIALQRVPQMGWEYVLQPRYGVFYDFLLLAPILCWACRSPSLSPASLGSRAASTLLLALPCVLALVWIPVGRAEIPWIRAYNTDIAQDTWQLLQEPEQLPGDCNPFVVTCGFPEEVRSRLAQSLVGAGLNLASEEFRNRHGLHANESGELELAEDLTR